MLITMHTKCVGICSRTTFICIHYSKGARHDCLCYKFYEVGWCQVGCKIVLLLCVRSEEGPGFLF